jgi:hypothetical protein
MRKSPMLVALAVLVGLSGCYGNFNLTRKLWKWNGTIGTKWVNEAAFLGLVILPVYEFASLGDAIIFNSIEFWTGKNPVTAKNVKSIEAGDKQAVLSYTPDAHRLRVDNFEKGRITSTLIFEQGQEGMEARDAKGALLMSAKTVEGLVVLSDASGKQVGKYDPAKIAEMTP